MKSKLLSLCLLGFGVVSSVAQQVQPTFLWGTEKVFEVPESALYAHTEKLIFVSNISGNPSEKNGKGFISTMSSTGRVFNPHWIVGLNAPKGMAINGKKLFVSDISELLVVEIDERRVAQRYEAPQSLFLNDVAVADDGTVYVSDMKDNCIYRLKDGVFAKWLCSPVLQNVNGLTVVGDSLYAGTSDAIFAISTADAVVIDWARGTGSIDGLEWDGKGAFVYSDWNGRIYSIKRGGVPRLLINTTANNVGAADIGYNREKGIVYVPTFYDNRVTAYQVQ